jgi:hypothetical protein
MAMTHITTRLDIRAGSRRRGVYSIALFACLGFLLSATQIFGESPDYFGYNEFLDLARSEGLNILDVSRFEPGFAIFSVLLTTLFAANTMVYAWVVAAAMLLKGWAISAYSASHKIFIVVAVFYFARYFPLHELTQLRAACAIALILAGAILLWEGRWFIGTSICVSALLLHTSSLAVIPALFLPSSKRWQVVLIAFAVFVSTFFFSGLITGYLSSYLPIVEVYQTDGMGETKPNPFAIQLIIDWAMIAYSFISWTKLSPLMRRVVLLELIGMAIFYGGMEFAVIAHRIREFYSVFWIFFVADGLRRRGTKLVSYGFVIVSVCFYSYVFFISGNFFR